MFFINSTGAIQIMKKMLLLVLVTLLVSFASVTAFAADVCIITEREAAKIAFCDYIRAHGQIMIPELGLRVSNVSLKSSDFVVILSIYEKITNEVVYDCATYTITRKDGRIKNVKFDNPTPSDKFVAKVADEIVAGEYASADAISAKTHGRDHFSAICSMTLSKIREAATAKAMNDNSAASNVSKFFDNRF